MTVGVLYLVYSPLLAPRVSLVPPTPLWHISDSPLQVAILCSERFQDWCSLRAEANVFDALSCLKSFKFSERHKPIPIPHKIELKVLHCAINQEIKGRQIGKTEKWTI